MTKHEQFALDCIRVGIHLTPLLLAGFIGVLLRMLRRAGRPDRLIERITVAGVALTIGHTIAQTTLTHPPAWLPHALITPWVVTVAAALAHRLWNTHHRTAQRNQE
ncbi:hypothetical protein AB0F93_03490 [Micromonospora tulbaghiae]|uniref:hypothetical protein n=1 Tax=Micromonospora tulbaghiae TaxID=479978 RepID=UPI003331D686